MSKILLVDDDPELSSLYQELLVGEGYQVETALNGETALEKISAGGYDLILLDIMMPKIDGLEILRKLKSMEPSPKNGKIVMLSALDQVQIINEARRLGADGFLHKPDLTPEQFLDEIQNYLKPQ